MQADFDSKEQEAQDRRSGLRNAVAILLIALAVGIALFVSNLGEDGKVADDPAFEALVEAESHLAQSYAPEQDALRQSQIADHELRAAINLLAAAKKADPAMTKQIEELRAGLMALESEKGFEGMTPQELQARYQTLRSELEALIDAERARRR